LVFVARSLRARAGRTVLEAGLLALALASNAVQFSAADSFVFNRVLYPDAERLVEIHGGLVMREVMTPALIDEWRAQADLFADVQASQTATLFLVDHGQAEMVPAANVTVGLPSLLGIAPRWGRTFAEGDQREIWLQPVLIAESLARQRFGDPAAAVGRRIETSGEPLLVIGVMPAGFEYPDGGRRIWRAFDPRGPLGRSAAIGFWTVARIAPGVTLETLAERMRHRSPAVAAAAGAPAEYVALPAPLRGSVASDDERRLFVLLLGAAACLLLLACASVAHLELAGVTRRLQTFAIQRSLGASRASIVRAVLVEGACIVGVAAVASLVLSRILCEAVTTALPPRTTRGTLNPIDIDARTLLAMALAAGAVWMLASVPVVFAACRANVVELLKMETHLVRSSRLAGIVRASLTVAQIAIAVVLLVGTVLHVRSYRALVAADNGFDSSGVVSLFISIPPQIYRSLQEKRVLGKDAVDRLRARPGILAAADLTAPPSSGTVFAVSELAIDDRPPLHEDIRIAEIDADADYFSVLRIPVRAGRLFRQDEPDTNVIVSETFANRYWHDAGRAVGGRFRRGPQGPWLVVVGVVGHVRSLADPPGAHSQRLFQTYVPRRPIAAASRDAVNAVAASPQLPATGGSYGFVNLIARVDSRSRSADLLETVRAIDRRLVPRAEIVSDVYDRQFGDRLIAAQIIGAFGTFAFIVALMGVYGVVSFMVTSRRAEFGIRIALGATGPLIMQQVLLSSARLLMIGVIVAIACIVAVSGLVQPQLFDVNATDPVVIVGTATLVVLASLAAAWRPVRLATRTDPADLLRAL
jgi:predicted permease